MPKFIFTNLSEAYVFVDFFKGKSHMDDTKNEGHKNLVNRNRDLDITLE